MVSIPLSVYYAEVLYIMDAQAAASVYRGRPSRAWGQYWCMRLFSVARP